MTLEQFILQNFEAPVSVNDLESFLQTRVFFNVGNPPALMAGGSQPATPGDAVSVPVVQTPHGPMVVMYTEPTDARLNKPFAGVLLDEAIQIVHAMQTVKGLLLQSSQEAALAIQKSPANEVKTR